MTFRICPGSHECRMGLGLTREIASSIVQKMGPKGENLVWAMSGCPNSCAQPQLADVGVVISRLDNVTTGDRHPRFDILRGGTGEAFARPVATYLTFDELVVEVERLG